MKNDEIKYYQYVGSQEKADEYKYVKPIINKFYSENDKVSHNDVAYFAIRCSTEINLEWKLVDKPNTK
jgi:hypothetical protein